MANTVVNGVTNATLNPVRVQETLISTIAERDNPFAALIGTSKDSVIQRITDLEKKKGDTVRFHFKMKQAGEGVDGDAVLFQNEDDMEFLSDTLTIQQKRKGIRLDGQMTEQRSVINLRKEAADSLGVWAREWLTEMFTYYLSGARGVRTGELILPTTFAGFGGNALAAPDAGHLLIAGAGTKVGLTANDKTSTTMLDKAVRNIKLMVNSGAAMRPTADKGKGYFHCFLPPEMMYDLRNDARWEQAQREANVRGNENPLLSGADGIWNGLVIRELSCGVLFDDYGATADIPAARGFIVGSQALGLAFGGVNGATDASGGRWRYIEDPRYDYENQVGFAVATILGMKKLRYNNADYGVYTLDAAYTA